MKTGGVGDFNDYRLLVRSFIRTDKRGDGRCTVAGLAKRIGASPSQLKMVLTGKRNLSEEQMLGISEAFNFSFEEKIYFEALVKENQATSEEVRRFHQKRRKAAKKEINVSGHTVGKKVSLENWYSPALLLYLIDVEDIANKPWEQIDRTKIKALFALGDAELDKMISTYKAAEILNFKRDGKVQIKLSNVGTKLKRQEFTLRVIDEARTRAQKQFEDAGAFFSADTLSISESEVKNFAEDYKRLIASYIAKDLANSEKTKIMQVALQTFSIN